MTVDDYAGILALGAIVWMGAVLFSVVADRLGSWLTREPPPARLPVARCTACGSLECCCSVKR